MLLALAMFAAGMVEYFLAAYWTQVVVKRDAGRTAVTTFLSVMLWGFVVANIRLSDPALLVIHGLGCAVGAGAVCWWQNDEPSLDERPEPEAIGATDPGRPPARLRARVEEAFEEREPSLPVAA